MHFQTAADQHLRPNHRLRLHIDNQTYLVLLQSSRANANIVSSNYCIPTVEEIYDLQDHEARHERVQKEPGERTDGCQVA